VGGVRTDEGSVKSKENPFVLFENTFALYDDNDYYDPVEFYVMVAPGIVASQTFNPSWNDVYHYYGYQVTNAKGESGYKEDLDPFQCWVTNAHKKVTADNGFTNPFDYTEPEFIAPVNDSAKFQDGPYEINFRLEDKIHRASNDKAVYKKHKVQVDNFKPYVKRVTVQSCTNNAYEKVWEWDEASTSLQLIEPRTNQINNVRPGADVLIIVEASEMMKNVIIDKLINETMPLRPIADAPENRYVSLDSTIWTFAIQADQILDPGMDADTIRIFISGEDLSGNELIAAKDKDQTELKNLPKRKYVVEDGRTVQKWDWDPNLFASQDQTHKFVVANKGPKCFIKVVAPFTYDPPPNDHRMGSY